MMNLNDTISAFRCCTLVPPRCSKCPLTEMCKWSLNKDRCKTEVKLSVNHWLKAQEQVVMAGAELTDAELIEEIRKAPIVLKPNVDAVPVVHGRWIDENQDDSLDPRMRCSICTGVESPLLKWRYCPNCGAKMDGERRDEDATD